MHDAVQWIALFGIIVVGVLFISEVRKWRAIGSVMTRQQRILRVVLIVFVEALFVMMLIGPAVTERKDPISSLLYWTICLILGLSVVVLALLDLKTVAGQYVQLKRQIFRDLRGDDRREE